MRIFDLVLSILLITCVAVTVYYIFKARVDYDITATKYSLEVLCDRFKNIISDIINMDMDLLNLNKRDLNNRRALKRSLSNAIRRCSQGI